MALPNDTITTTLVRNAIGETHNRVHDLMMSNNVNRWGFNSPWPPQQRYYWGVASGLLNNKAELGAFRGYDHSWRCYTLDRGEITGLLHRYDNGTFTIYLRSLSGDAPATTIYHYFDAFISRYPFSTHNEGVQVWNEQSIDNGGSASFSIDPLGIGDGLGVVPANSTLYVKIVHTTSPDRRFDFRQCGALWESNILASVDISTETVIFEIPVGEDPFDYYSYGSVITDSYFVSQETDMAMVELNVYSGNNQPVTLTFTADFNVDSNFSSTGFQLSGNVTLPAATYDVNGNLIRGTGSIVLLGNSVAGAFTVGANWYGRVRITAATKGTFSNSYNNFQGVVLDTPPA